MQKLSFDLFDKVLHQTVLDDDDDNNNNNNNNGKSKIEALKSIVKKVMMEQLTQRQLEVCLLYFYDEMKLADIARLLSVNKSTVGRTLARAIKNISDKVKYYNIR